MAKASFYDINHDKNLDDFHKKFNEIADKPSLNWYRRIFGNDVSYWHNERFYVSDKKYQIMYGGEIFVNGNKYPYEDYLTVDLIALSTKERYSFDVAKLLRKIDVVSMETLDFSKPTTVMSNSPINQYVYNRVSKIKPYFTNKELVDIFIECVGNRQIYFEEVRYRMPFDPLTYLKNGKIKTISKSVLDVHFVKI